MKAESPYEKYSAFALDQIIAEYKAEEPWLPVVLNSFVGSYSSWSLDDLLRKLTSQQLGVTAKPVREMLVTLVSIGFMGVRLETETSVMFASSVQKGIALAEKVRTSPTTELLELEIHPVFASHLHIKVGPKPEDTPLEPSSPVPIRDTPTRSESRSTPSKPRYGIVGLLIDVLFGDRTAAGRNK